MATAEELLAAQAGTDEKICIIDLDTRQINIPKSIVALGVESDDDVKLLTFRMPSVYHDVDLSDFGIRVVYVNANNDEPEFYEVLAREVVNGMITFNWRVDRPVLKYKGTVRFAVCMTKADPETGEIVNELHTTIASLPVLEGLEADTEGISDLTFDPLAQLLAAYNVHKDNLGIEYKTHKGNLTSEYNIHSQNLSDTATALAKTVGEPYRSRANAIVNAAEGSVISVNDASDDYLRGLRVFGKSTQVTTTGTNLFSASLEVGLWVFSTKTKTINASYIKSTDLVAVSPGESYIFSGTAIKSFQGNLAFYDVNGVYLGDDRQVFGFNSFTVPSDAYFIAFHIGATFLNDINGTVQLVKGSVSTDYEPYSGGFASPSPDWPQPINSIESPKIHIYGKNLLNTVNTTKSANGVTFTVNSDKSVTINGTSTESTFFNIDMDSEINYQGAELIVSLDGSTNTSYLNVGYFTEDAKFVDTFVTVGSDPKTFVYPDEAVKSRVYMFVTAATTFNNVTVRPMIRLATNENGVYEPYVESQTLTIPHTLPGIPVDSGGNYTDENGQQWICDEIDFERGKYIQRIGRFELDGGAKWVEYASDPTPNLSYRGFMIWNMLDETCSRPNGFCNQFQTVGAGTDNCVWVGANGDYCVYVVSKEWHNKGIDAWKAHLNENPLEVIYTRVAPIYHDLSESELAAYSQLHSNYPTTTVMNDQGAHMEMKYNADTKRMISSAQPNQSPIRVIYFSPVYNNDPTVPEDVICSHTPSVVYDWLANGCIVIAHYTETQFERYDTQFVTYDVDSYGLGVALGGYHIQAHKESHWQISP